MGKTRPIYGRFTRGLKPHEAAKGEGFTPELWRKVDVTGKPILDEHDWRNPGPVGTFIRNWVEYDQKTGAVMAVGVDGLIYGRQANVL